MQGRRGVGARGACEVFCCLLAVRMHDGIVARFIQRHCNTAVVEAAGVKARARAVKPKALTSTPSARG